MTKKLFAKFLCMLCLIKVYKIMYFCLRWYCQNYFVLKCLPTYKNHVLPNKYCK